MVDFLLCVVQYVLIALVLCAVAGLGIFLGKKKRDASNAKKAALAEKTTEE